MDRSAAAIRARIVYCGYLGQIMLNSPISKKNEARLIDELLGVALQDIS